MILIIDTSSEKSLIVKASASNFESKIFGSSFNHSEKLLIEINKLFKNGDLKKLEGITVISGPGSYTGLRVGIATANALSYSLNIPAVGINRLEWLAYQAESKKEGKVCAVVSAIHDQIFAGFYSFDKNDKLKQRDDFFAGDLKDFSKKIKSRTIFIVEKKEKFAEIINENILKKLMGRNFLEMKLVNFFGSQSAQALIDLSFDKLKKMSEKEIITPLYIRKPNITWPAIKNK